jgi:FkbM family methyltransferase
MRIPFSRTLKRLLKNHGRSSGTKPSVLVEKGEGTNLYKTKDGFLYWLKPDRYLDQDVINKGMFEEQIVTLAEKFVSPGDVVLDVGANFGLFSVVFARMVGAHGKVLAFEPTKHYLSRLRQNIAVNGIENCEIVDVGLSDADSERIINIGPCSATMHWFKDAAPVDQEVIRLTTLDAYLAENPVSRLDFIKLDIDGHEPSFFAGAWETLDKYEPVIVAEMSEGNFFEAGHHVWELFDDLKGRGYHLYNEYTLEEYVSRREFLMKCGNFAYSGNVVISKRPL